jgi:hypothetical protein
MLETNLVAWWGAVVATLVLLWDVAKWLKAGPVIRVRIQLDTWYPDGKVIKVEKIEHGEMKELAEYCHIELVNVGKLPTTVMGIEGSHQAKSGRMKTSLSSQSFTPHYGKQLPYVLPPGEVWSCRFEMVNLLRLLEQDKPYIEVHLSHNNKPLMIWPKLSANHRLKSIAESSG